MQLRNSQNGCQHIKGFLWEFRYLAGIFNEIRFTLFNWCVLASCVAIFQIRCDFSDFLYPEFPLIKRVLCLMVEIRDKGNRLKVKCILLKIPVSIYLLESIT